MGITRYTYRSFYISCFVLLFAYFCCQIQYPIMFFHYVEVHVLYILYIVYYLVSMENKGLQSHSDGIAATDSCCGMQFSSKEQKIKSCQSLLCLLQALCNCSATIELRNEVTVKGIISDVDCRMKYVRHD